MRKVPVASLLAVSAAALACGSSSTSVGRDAGVIVKDASIDRSASHDAKSGHEASHDAGATLDAASGDAGDAGTPPTPTGTAIETGHDMVIIGVTEDGHVVYQTDSGISAAPVAGGHGTQLASAGDAASAPVAVVSHNVVFLWSNVDFNSGAGTLSVWTSSMTGPPKPVSTASQPPAFHSGFAAASADSSAIVFSTATSADGTTTSLAGATLSSLASPTVLASGLEGAGGCTLGAVFTGTAAPFYAVATFCEPVDAGDTPATVNAYSTNAWAAGHAGDGGAPPLATSVTTFSVDQAAKAVAVGLDGGQLEIAALGGAARVPIDTASTLPPAPLLYLSKTDKFVLYATASGALKTSPVTMSSPTTLVASAVNGLDAVSPNEAWAFVHNGTDPNTTLPSDLSLASTATPGTPTTLVMGTTVAGVLGDAFTSDATSSYAIFMTNIVQDNNNNDVGTLCAVATAAPTKIIKLATAAVNSATYSPADLALSGTKLSFTDNFNANIGNTGSVDLHVVDLATTTPSTIVMSGADPLYAVSFDKQHILYTITFGGSTDGIYTVPVP